MKLAVIGLGQFGKSVAALAAKAGVEVIAVDEDMAVIEELKDTVAMAIQMDATDERELKAQGIDKVDVLVAAMGNFEANQLVTVIAKRYGVKKVIARASSPLHVRILKLIGADEVLNPEEEAAERLAQRLVTPSLKNYFELIDGYSVAEIETPAEFHGKTVEELQLRKNFGMNLVAIRRKLFMSGKDSVNAALKPTDIVLPNDVLTIVGKDEDIANLARKPTS